MQPQSWDLLRAASTIYEDDSVLALNKPAGLSVTGERHDTDVVDLARQAGDELWPAHRIDKATSGVVLFARVLAAHGGITRQFNPAVTRRPGGRPVGKVYLAVVRCRAAAASASDAADGAGIDCGPGDLPGGGTIDLPLGPGRKGRIRVAAPRESIRFDPGAACWTVPTAEVTVGKAVYPSVTTFETLWQGPGGLRLLAVTPVTGRRHQIRVHLAWIGHAIVGDPLFEREPAGRALLHAWRLSLDASWSDGRRLELAAEPDADFLAAVPGLPGSLLSSPSASEALARLDARTAAAGTGTGGPPATGGSAPGAGRRRRPPGPRRPR